MIAEIAHGLTWLACACAVLQLYAAWRLPDFAGASASAIAVGWLWLWILPALAWLFWSLDFSVVAVAANTHSALPDGLRLAAAVLRPGGCWPILAAVVAWVGAVAAWRGASRTVLSGFAAGTLVLHAVLLGAFNPFMRADPAPVEGAGFSATWRDRLATFGDTRAPFVAMPFAVGARVDGVSLHAVTPVAGADSTGVVGEVRIATDGAPLVLLPEWRETILPRHASGVPDSGWADGGLWRATIGPPRSDGRFMLTVARVRLLPFVIAALIGVGGVAWFVVVRRVHPRR